MTIKRSLKELINLNNMEDGMTEKQLNILIAAIELFSEKGYEATATSEIAKKAKVAEGTIFRYYKTKKDLLFSIPASLSNSSLFEVFITDFIRILNNDNENFETFLRKIVLNRKNFVSETAPILKVLIQEVPFHPELRSKILNIVILPIVSKLTKAIDRFKEQGEIIDMPTISIVDLIATSIFGYFFLHFIAMPELTQSEDDLENLIQYIIRGLRKN